MLKYRSSSSVTQVDNFELNLPGPRNDCNFTRLPRPAPRNRASNSALAVRMECD